MGAEGPLQHRDRLLLAERDDWGDARVETSGDAVLLVRSTPQGDVLMARGDAAGVADLLDGEARLRYRTQAEGALWLSAPRAAAVPAPVLDALRLEPAAHWDWMSTTAVPGAVEVAVRRLDPAADADVIRELLREANPRSTADPAGAAEIGWWGVFGRRDLLGVIGARRQQGDPRGSDLSWHLHGLGVSPMARRLGYGEALTAAATAAGLAEGADWVSLGLYAENDGARRIYQRLGFALEAEMASFGPVSAGWRTGSRSA